MNLTTIAAVGMGGALLCDAIMGGISYIIGHKLTQKTKSSNVDIAMLKVIQTREMQKCK